MQSNGYMRLSSLALCLLLIGLSLLPDSVSQWWPKEAYGSFTLRKESNEEKRVQSRTLSAAFTAADEPSNDLFFVGDVLLARNVEYLTGQHGEAYPYAGVDFGELAHKPYVVANFEATVPERHVPTPPLQIKFSVDEARLAPLRMAGFTHLSLANNHSFDFGASAYSRTQTLLAETAIESFGHPRILNEGSVRFVELESMRVALIGLHATEQVPEQSQMEAVMRYASTQSELQVLYVHWGTEYADKSSATQQRIAKLFVEEGVDLVVGHHPHVVQEVGLVDGVPVFYSLGNYIFDQYFDVAVMEGLMLHLSVTEGGRVGLLPVESATTLSQPRFLNPADHAEFLEDLAERSDPLLAANIRRGYVPLSITVATSTEIAMMNSINAMITYVQ
jgi:hypothetical protein